jgi:cell division protein FtsI (penicillin-binding protein 3)
MIRKPLRPLARIFSARSAGENPDLIENANRRERIDMQHERIVRKTQRRLIMMGGIFVISFGVIGMRMTALAVSEPSEPKARATAAQIVASRADIIDRNNRVLATNIETHSLYAHPHQVVDSVVTARQLAEIFPDIDVVKMEARLNGAQKFLWLKGAISPEEKQAVHDIGDPGLLFGPREMRLYPNGQLAGHILGGTTFGEQGVHSAEVLGIAGVESAFDGFLRDPKFNGRPLQLSIDLSVQSALEEVLYGGMRLMNAKGASAVLMQANTGEIFAMSSLPDFDPNNRPRALTQGNASDSPLFNRAVQGVYELGSAFKPFAVAQAMELGLIEADTMVDTKGPLKWGRHSIRDYKNYGPELSVEKILIKSSNIGTARISLMIGSELQKTFLGRLGLLKATSIELIEGPTGKPQYPKNWSDISTMTISYGHGISTSPVHLAAAYAALINGGTLVEPTVLKQTAPPIGERIISQKVSMRLRSMLRHVVSEGTARFGEVPGYSVAGKTGTADKPNTQGGYHKDKVLATFASFFPSTDPKYVLIVTLDEPEDRAGSEPRRTAGWTAVPVAAEVIRRVAPLLGLAPEIETSRQNGLTLANN